MANLSSVDLTSTTDPYLLDAPFSYKTHRDDTNRFVYFNLISGGLFGSPSDPKYTEYYYISTADTTETRDLDSNDYVTYEPAVSGLGRQYSYLTRTRNGELPDDDGNIKRYMSPVGVGQAPSWINLYYEQDLDSSLTGYTDYTLEVTTCKQWHNVDAAELLFSLTKFYAGEQYVDYIHLSGLREYSESMIDNYNSRVRMDWWAEDKRSLSDDVASILYQSGAYSHFGITTSGVPLDFKLTLKNPSNLNTWSDTLDLTTFKEQGVIGSSVMRYTTEFVQNRYNVKWGSFLIQTLPDDLSGDNAGESELDIEGDLPRKVNEITIIHSGSVTQWNEQPVDVALPNIQDPREASARMMQLKDRWTDTVRVLTWTMGPLHFDFGVGDIVTIDCEEYGLDSVEFLVTNKVYDWDDLSASIEAVEYTSVTYVLSPDGTQELTDRMSSWFTPDNIYYTGANVTAWLDAGDFGYHASQDVTAPTATMPTISLAAINGYNAINCTPSGVNTGMEFAGMDRAIPTRGLQVFAVINPNLDPDTHSDTQSWLRLKDLSVVSGDCELGFKNGKYWCKTKNEETSSTEDFVDGWQVLTWVVSANDYLSISYNGYYDLTSLLVNGELKATDNPYMAEYFIYPTILSTQHIGYSDDASPGFGGEIAEIIVYADALRPHETQGVINYLKNKYNI